VVGLRAIADHALSRARKGLPAFVCASHEGAYLKTVVQEVTDDGTANPTGCAGDQCSGVTFTV
jgi:hypothetical protein